jgi:5-methyltetrahydropteroyltriglutamate--homocysteine methyltransferase
MPIHPLTTQIVGSYVKPKWLARPERMRALDGSFWRPEAAVLAEAREDAARLAIYEQERAGLDLVGDGEAQRAAYDRHFFQGLTGLDFETLARSAFRGEVATVKRHEHTAPEYAELSELKPCIVSDVRWERPVVLDELRFLKSHARKPVKINVVGPFSLFAQTVDRYYGDEVAAVLAFAMALNQELRAIANAGADVIQIDDPMMHFRLSLARDCGKEALTRMVAGVTVPIVVHVCYGYAYINREKSGNPSYPELLELLSDCPISGMSIEYAQPRHSPELLRHCGGKHVVLGLLDLGRGTAETADEIAGRLRDALRVIPPERLHPSSDCGMWYLERELAFGKISALVEGTHRVRRELGLPLPA